MTDLSTSWRVLAVGAILVLVALAGICRVAALLRTSLSMLGILRREHARRSFGPDDFAGGWAWYLYRASGWFIGMAAALLLLLLVTRIFGRMT